jgi:hypothetical protein
MADILGVRGTGIADSFGFRPERDVSTAIHNSVHDSFPLWKTSPRAIALHANVHAHFREYAARI